MEEGRTRIESNGRSAGRFALDRTDSLNPIDWQPVAGVVKKVNGASVFLLDPEPLPTEAYYRVRVVLD